MADTETKPEVKTEEVKAEEKAEMKTEAATEVKKEDNGDVKTEAKAEESSEVKSEVNGSGDAAPSDLEKKIIKQVEFYFGDMNLSRDKFLQTEIKTDDGWIPLSTMVKFNRLRTMSEDLAVIAAALKKSTSGLLEINEDQTKIRRSPDKPIKNTMERQDEIKARSVYAKGFPLDITLDGIQDFLEKYGTVEHVQMRKDMEKKFKGSVFAIFQSEEVAKKFLDEKDLKYGETEMVTLLKDDYFKMKNEEKKQKRDVSIKEQQEDREKRLLLDKEKLMEKITKGAILHLEGLSEDTMREMIKAKFEDIAKIAWVDFDKGDKEAWIRFDGEVLAKEALEKVLEQGEGKLEINDCTMTTEVLEGEAELKHWRGIFRSQQDRRQQKRGHHGGGFRGKRHWGGRGGRRDRGDRDGGEPASKRAKSDS